MAGNVWDLLDARAEELRALIAAARTTAFGWHALRAAAKEAHFEVRDLECAPGCRIEDFGVIAGQHDQEVSRLEACLQRWMELRERVYDRFKDATGPDSAPDFERGAS